MVDIKNVESIIDSLIYDAMNPQKVMNDKFSNSKEEWYSCLKTSLLNEYKKAMEPRKIRVLCEFCNGTGSVQNNYLLDGFINHDECSECDGIGMRTVSV